MERLTSARPWEEAKEDLVNEPGYSFLWQRLNAIEKVLGKDYDLDRLKEIVEKSTRPAADVVEVVRCKDCKWWQNETCTGDVATDNEGGADFSINFGPDDFCSYGERRQNVRGQRLAHRKASGIPGRRAGRWADVSGVDKGGHKK